MSKYKNGEYNKNRYHNDDMYKQKHISYVKQYKKKHIKWFQNIKSKLMCEICMEKHPRCLDFHHIVDKTNTVANITYKCSKSLIILEMKKCIILCCNCHRKIHANIIDISQPNNKQLLNRSANNKAINKFIIDFNQTNKKSKRIKNKIDIYEI